MPGHRPALSTRCAPVCRPAPATALLAALSGEVALTGATVTEGRLAVGGVADSGGAAECLAAPPRVAHVGIPPPPAVMRAFVLLPLLALAACDSGPEYSGPADYAYTLTVSCFCLPLGPLRVTVFDDAVVDVVALAAPEGAKDDPQFQESIERAALTLAELSALAERAEREADEVFVEYHPVFGFPTQLSIDWSREIADEEVAYTVTDYEAR